ncbi:hypothetical protein YB2330_005225 [Saitoella coloradoensis]
MSGLGKLSLRGLTLEGLHPAAETSKAVDPKSPLNVDNCKVVHLKLTKEALQEIVNSNGKGLNLTLGKNNALHIGNTTHTFFPLASNGMQIYKLPCHGENTAECYGKVDRTFQVQRKGTAVSEAAKAANLSAQSSGRSIKILDESIPDTKRGAKVTTKKPIPLHLQKNTALSGSGTKSMPSSPALPAQKVVPKPQTPNFMQLDKSAPKRAAASPQFAPGLPDLRLRVAHMLALNGKMKKGPLLQKFRGSGSGIPEITRILDQIATPSDVSSSPEYALKDEIWKEIDVWAYGSWTDEDREAVAKKAADVFDRLGLKSEHPARLRLNKGNKVEQKIVMPASPANSDVSVAAPSPQPPKSRPGGGIFVGKDSTKAITKHKRTASVSSDKVAKPESPLATRANAATPSGRKRKPEHDDEESPTKKVAKDSAPEKKAPIERNRDYMQLPNIPKHRSNASRTMTEEQVRTPISPATAPKKPSPLGTADPISASDLRKRKAGDERDDEATNERPSKRPASVASPSASMRSVDELMELSRRFVEEQPKYEKMRIKVNGMKPGTPEWTKLRAEAKALGRQLEEWKRAMWDYANATQNSTPAGSSEVTGLGITV